MLDEFEGADYQRVLVPATLNNGTQLQAFVYAINNMLQRLLSTQHAVKTGLA